MSQGKNIMLGTAGHVDHGKTALVKLLTGCDTDKLADEKKRGLTIELGFAPCRMADERVVGVVDVPGHVGFIRNMVAGAQGIDVVILVVAADDGVMPQTREHLDILTVMGVRRGIIALTKIDLVDGEMRNLAADETRDFVAGTFLESAPICPISNITGEGFNGFFSALDEAVRASDTRDLDGVFRLWVERVFTIHGFGTVVSGIPSSGEVHVGDRLTLSALDRTVRVRKLQVYGRDAEVGRVGECVALNLSDANIEAVGRGALLTGADMFPPASMVEAEVAVLGRMGAPLKDYAECHVHIGTAEVMANVAMLAGEPIAPGERGMVQLRMREPLAVAPGERFVLRTSIPGVAGGHVTTVGGGCILDASDKRLRRNRPWLLERLAARRDALGSPVQWCGVILCEADGPLTTETLAQRAKMPIAIVRTSLETLIGDGIAVAVDGKLFVHAGAVEGVGRRAIDQLNAFHESNPLRLGITPADLAADLDVDDATLALAVDRLASTGAVLRRGELLAAPDGAASIPAADIALARRIEAVLREAGLEPPLPTDLAAAVGESVQRVATMIPLLADQGLAALLDRKVVMHSEAVERAKAAALDLFRAEGRFTTMQYRDALGVSRKYAVPLLDYFDTIRFTARSGSLRRPGVEAAKLL